MPKVKTETIDILEMELSEKLPHWLSAQQQLNHTHDAERKRRQQQHAKERNARKKPPKKKTIRAFDPDQPRDESGKWTDGDGGSGGAGKEPSGAARGKDPKSASALVKPVTMTTDEVIASVPGSKERIAGVRAKLARSTPTDTPVAKGGYKRPDGTWTPERAAVHRAIVAKILTPEAIANATPKEGEKPVLHLLGGRGGSGKSWFTGPKGTIDKSTSIYLNNDDVKNLLPEWQGWNAANLHEESSDIGATIENAVRAAKLNTIIDGTMKTGRSLAARVEAYRAAGYRVEAHYMFTSPENSAKRALGQFMKGGETGRFVPPEYSLGSTTNEESFDSIRDRVDAWEIYDNDGAAPKFHARGGTKKS